MKTKPRLLASATSVESIVKMISEYYVSSSVRIEESEPGTFDVYTGSGHRNSVRVKLARGRYRFEMI